MAKWSIMRKSDCEKSKRMDAEYHDPKYVNLEELIETRQMKKISNNGVSLLITDGDHGNPEYSEGKEGRYYIRSKDLTSFGIDFGKAERVTEEYSAKLGDRCALNNDEVLISTVGTIGVPSIALDDFPPSVLSRDIAKIVVNKDQVFPEYLFIFMSTDFFQQQIQRETSGSVQLGLYLHALKKMYVHLMSSDFQKEIKRIVEKMFDLNQRSKQLFDIGKKAIDIGIHKSEKEAMDFLKKSRRKYSP